MNQEEHHRIKSFKEEYLKMLSDFDVEYEDKCLFEFYERAEKNAAPMGLSTLNILELLPKFQPYGLLRIIKSDT